MTLPEQDRYEGPERRSVVEQKVWTPQFVWQMFTWLFAQIIVAASLYLGISNRLTAIEVKMEERSRVTDRALDRERDERITDYKELRAWIASTDKAVSDLKAVQAYEAKGK